MLISLFVTSLILSAVTASQSITTDDDVTNDIDPAIDIKPAAAAADEDERGYNPLVFELVHRLLESSNRVAHRQLEAQLQSIGDDQSGRQQAANDWGDVTTTTTKSEIGDTTPRPLSAQYSQKLLSLLRDLAIAETGDN